MARVLVVDDEEENRRALHRALADKNPDWSILVAQNGSDALAMISEQKAKGEPVDLLLTDLVMEDVDSGISVLKEARLLDPTLMAILFTAKEIAFDRLNALELGAFDVIEKNVVGSNAFNELNHKARRSLIYKEWSERVGFLRRYFDPKLFETIKNDSSVLDTSRRMVTVSFWDVRGFSKLCEILKAYPELATGFLREYCETAAQTIFEFGGVLDKFIGDGVMALFGVLNHKDDDGTQDAIAAVRAAMELRTRFHQIETRWGAKWRRYVPQKIEIGLGCGLNTGEALVGNVGTDFRDQFTALGVEVNAAARIQGVAAAGEIVLAETTYSRVKDIIPTQSQFEVEEFKNMPGPFCLYRV